MKDQKLTFLLPLAATLTHTQRAETLALTQLHGTGLAIHLLTDARSTLFHTRASIVASGTATVEAALMGNPFVVVYRVSALTYAIAKRVVKVPHVAMANLIAGKRAVPELIQHDFTAENIVQHIRGLLPDGPPRQSMMNDLEMIREKLTSSPVDGNNAVSGAIERVAAITLQQIQPSPQAEPARPVQS